VATRPGIRAGLLLLLLASAVRVRAATVTVQVVERGGRGIGNQRVVLYPVVPGEPFDTGAFVFHGRGAGSCTTDAAGACTIDGLAAGVYVPDLRPLVDPNMAPPIGSLTDAYGTVTLGNAEARETLRIELDRGVRVELRLAFSKTLPSSRAVELTSDTGLTTRTMLDSRGLAEVALAGGHWTAHLTGPQTALLASVELDGEPLDTADVPFTLTPPSSSRFITWTITEPCSVYGMVASNRPQPGVTVAATLVAPGPWASSPFCRGVDCAGAPQSGVGPNGWYSMEFPCGGWSIAPAGPSLIESMPPSARVDLADGLGARVDFTVREKEPNDEGDDSKDALAVHVEGPTKEPIASAPVELWPDAAPKEGGAPLGVKTTFPFGGTAYFEHVPADTAWIRVKVPGFLTGVVPVPAADPERKTTRRTTVRLGRGASIEARVRDAADHPVPGVALEVVLVDPPDTHGDASSRLAAQDPIVDVPPSTDQTGHLLVTGLVGGTYAVKPELSGPSAPGATLEIGAPGQTRSDSATISLAENGHAELEIRVVPAASLSGRLACADGGPIVPNYEACVLRPPPPGETEVDRERCKQAVIPVRTGLLTGDARDTFRVGPLTPGPYRLSLRPRGYAEWTWALGSPNPDDAVLAQVLGTSAVELGTIKVLCGPAIEIRPSVKSTDPALDMSLSVVSGVISRTGKDGKKETRTLVAERSHDRVVFRELPEGEWALDATVAHPHILPPAPIHLSATLTLERGKLSSQRPAVTGVGGAVVVLTSAGTARLIAVSGEARVEAGKNGRVEFDGVAPGTYTAEECRDHDCTTLGRRWAAVEVAAAATRELRP